VPGAEDVAVLGDGVFASDEPDPEPLFALGDC
jgi:hypothetical protein